ncbi:A predicted alpha-helical domain with a conserved ER motif family protein [Mycobacterium xenopi 3993]|nr:A predicted alpha-helical domain with a conserved ER motif family protein [Mycobacterium xenopi 3993]
MGTSAGAGTGGADGDRTPPERPTPTPAGTRGISSPRVLSDLFWLGRYGERAESMARLLSIVRDRYHDYRSQPDGEGRECVSVLLAALQQITGADGADAAAVAATPRTLWSLTVDRERSGSLAQSVERLGLSARAVRDQMSNDTWMVLGGVERALAQLAAQRPNGQPEDDTALASTHALTLAECWPCPGWPPSRWCATSTGP